MSSEPIEWNLVDMLVESLQEMEHNPRSISKKQHEQLKRSIQTYGLIDKPIVNLDGTIIGGHQRYRICKELGHKSILVWMPDRELSEEEVKELNVRVNKNGGQWDYEILANHFDLPKLEDMGFNISTLLDEKQEEKTCKVTLVFENERHRDANWAHLTTFCVQTGAEIKSKKVKKDG